MKIGIIIKKGESGLDFLYEHANYKVANMEDSLCIKENDVTFIFQNRISPMEMITKILNKNKIEGGLIYVTDDALNDYLSYLPILTAKGVRLIKSDYSENQIIDLLENYHQGDYRKKHIENVVCFIGEEHKIGTSDICEQVTRYIAKKTGKKIVLMTLNGKCGHYKEGNGEIYYLDRILPTIKNKTTGANEIRSIEMSNRMIPKMTYIHGIENYLEIENLTDEMIGSFIHSVGSLFDVVIIDGGLGYENKLAMGALKNAMHRILIEAHHSHEKINFKRVNDKVFKTLQIRDFIPFRSCNKPKGIQAIGNIIIDLLCVSTSFKRGALEYKSKD